jgi:signal transduction histidine kinase
MKPLLLLFLIVLPVFTPPLVFSIDSENRVKKSTLSRKNQLSSELAIEEEKKTADVLFKAGFNVKEKEEIVVNLVNRGAEYLENHELADACNTFSSSQSFMSGEVYLFVFDKEGRIIAHGEQLQLMFQNLYNTKDQFGTLYVQNIIKTANS